VNEEEEEEEEQEEWTKEGATTRPAKSNIPSLLQ